MSRRVLPVFAIIAVASVLVLPGWAKDSSSAEQGTVELTSTTNVADKTLAPGEYKLVAQNNQAMFEQHGKVVAEVPCTLKTLPSKASQTAAVMDHNRLTEVQLSGKTQAIEFSSGGASGN